MSPALRYAWYGDDFTGASDTLATVASAGLSAALFLQVPTQAQREAIGPLDAVGIAGTARALSPSAQLDELAPVAAGLRSLHPLVTHYKCCSTFDSTPDIGNLAIGAGALRGPEHRAPLLVIGGQPSLGRFCAFGHLFASAGQGGEVHRIDRHPTMSRHPVTPMTESDLRRLLLDQGLGRVGLIDVRCLDRGDLKALKRAMQLALALDATPDATPGAKPDAAPEGVLRSDALLFDAVRDEHLRLIGQAWWQWTARSPLLALGASSVAQALVAAWPNRPGSPSRLVTASPAQGPVFCLVGSLSPVTEGQVAHAHEAYERRDISAQVLEGSPEKLEALAQDCAGALNQGRSVMAVTSRVPQASSRPGDVAQTTARLLQRVLARSPGVRRVAVAGGDTSGGALRVLKPWALQWVGNLSPGVPMLRARAVDGRVDGLELVLKGGQMGPPDLFLKLIHGTTETAPDLAPA